MSISPILPVMNTFGSSETTERRRGAALLILPTEAELLRTARQCTATGAVSLLAIRITGLASADQRSADAAIDTIARRLRGIGDTLAIAPSGGDAFTVLSHAESVEQARVHADRIRRAIRTQVNDLPPAHLLRACVAVVVVERWGDAPAALAAANRVVDQARSVAPDHTATCAEGPDAWSARQLEVARRLARGSGSSDLAISYQPIVDRQGSVTGAEGLLRVAHANGEWACPDEFLSLATQIGAAPAVTDVVVDGVCRDLGRALARGDHPDLAWVSCNMNVAQLADPDCLPVILGALARSGLEPERLVVEVAEADLLLHEDAVRPALETLVDVGIGVAIDAFGATAGAFELIGTTPASIVKLDRRITARVRGSRGDRQFVEAVATRCEDNGIDLVAQGIEHESLESTMFLLGCTHGQGFLHGTASPLDRLDTEDARTP